MGAIYKGMAFWAKAENSDKEHLYFVITEPKDDEYNVLVVNMTTFHGKPFEEDVCILETGDHPAIKHTSYIYYKETIEINVIELLNGIITK